MITSEIKADIKAGIYDERLLDIYVDENLLKYNKERYIAAVSRYEQYYGEGNVCVCSAPGRSEIGGNHTDHQHGEVLAAAINLDAIAVVAPTQDGMVRIVSEGYDEIVINTTELEADEREQGTTAALIRGVLAGAVNRGYKVGGFTCYTTSDVLIGAGLSSSAAFEILIGQIISLLYNGEAIDAVTLAIIGQYAENVYFGKPCGLMDQMACSVGSMVHIDFADVNNPRVEKIDFDMNSHGYALCITDTKGSHADLTDEYAAILKEMKDIAGYFNREVLLGVSVKDILDNAATLRELYSDRAVLRALHFIRENTRVRKETEALKRDNTEEFLAQVKASGDSSFKYLQNVYSCRDVQHQNVAVALAVSDTSLEDGAGVSRVHGGGFAGTIQAFVRDYAVNSYRNTMDSVFGAEACKVLKIRKYGGMTVIG